jgi:two-component system chemotaxis response regulator CheY
MGRTILVVDDSAAIRQMATLALTEAGYEVITAEQGKDALEKLRATSVDMMLIDLNMPEMDGLEFIKIVRSRPVSKYTPIIIVSTETRADKKQEGRLAGASGWLIKPFRADVLTELVQKFIQ